MAYILTKSPKRSPIERQPKIPPINAISKFSFRKAKIPPSKAITENMIPTMPQTPNQGTDEKTTPLMIPRINTIIKDHPAMVRAYSGCV